MGTYSNLVPVGVCNSDYFEDPPWEAYEETLGEFTTTYAVSTDRSYVHKTAEFRFDLPSSVNVSRITISANIYPTFNAQGTLYANIINYNNRSPGTSASAQSASVTGVDSQRSFSFSNISFGNTNSFFVQFWSNNLVGDSPTTVETVDVGVIRANVLYTDPPPTPQPSVTINGPTGAVFEAGTAFTYSWSVSNGTQTSAQIQESSDGSTWTTTRNVSGSTTSLSETASGVGFHYWRVVVTFSGGTTVTSISGTYSVTEPYVPPAPDEPPYVGNISTTPVQPTGLPSTFSSVYIANVSKCKVEASVSAGTNPIRTVYFSYPGASGDVSMTYDSTSGKYAGTTPLALSATTQTLTITVTAEDNTGYYTSETVNVTVTPYADPTLTINTLIRCDAQGAEDDTGQYYKLKVTAGCSSVQSKNYITSLNAGVKNGTMHDITSGQFHTFGPELPNEDLVYVIRISVTDYVGHETWIERSLAGKLRDVVFKRDVQHKTAHIGVGMTPDGSTRTTVQLPPNGTIIIGGQDLISWLQSKLGESFPGWNQ